MTRILSALIAACLCLTAAANAQATEKVLYAFAGGKDAGWPGAGLAFDQQGNLYGTTTSFGPHGYGTVFRLTPTDSGWSENIIHSFCGDYPVCADGAYPLAAVILDPAGNLYSTTSYGGSAQGWGVVYQLTLSDGAWTETVLHRLSGKLGESYPAARLTMDNSGRLFGTAEGNPVTGGMGAVFELAPSLDGTWKHCVIYYFQGGTDGSKPNTALALDQNHNLFGTTIGGNGGIFKLTRHPNTKWKQNTISPLSGGGDLLIDGAGNLYGTRGSEVFELSRTGDGWKETVLFTFDPDEASGLSGVVFDKSGNLYGTARNAGLSGCANAAGCGSVFKLTPTNRGWTASILYSFTGGADGGNPVGGVVLDGSGNLYGATTFGGKGCRNLGCGVIFEIIQ